MTKDEKRIQFIEKAKNIHGGKYNYSKVEYVNCDTKVCIICPKHGEFWQTPYKHINMHQGCPKCSGKNRTTDEFIVEARKIHGDKYDYSKVDYRKAHKPVCIICPEHGEFWQSPSNHLMGQKCPICSKVYMDTDLFIKKSNEIHGEAYDYSKVEYINIETPVCIICKKHGEFWQRPDVHLMGCGCQECYGKKRGTNETFTEKANKVHHNKYDYSKIEYFNNKSKLHIICPKHGEFVQTASDHLTGCGCPVCGTERRSKYRSLGFSDFIKRANEVHNNKYDYSLCNYENVKDKVCIICPKHGKFWQVVDSHIRGCGCPSCGMHISKGEDGIFEFINSIGVSDIIKNDRKTISPYEIDLLIPEYKIGIEYNGLVWHSEKFSRDNKYHYTKMIMAKKAGYSLLQIFQDEYENKKEIVESKLRNIFQKSTYLPKIYGRKITVKTIDFATSSDFLEKNHIQGKARSTVYLGGFYNNKLIAVMTFVDDKNGKWTLNRFASDINYHCVGIGGKMFSYFVSNYKPLFVKSFADRRWTINEESNLYTNLGFHFDGYTKPDYKYFWNYGQTIRHHKFNFRKKIMYEKYGEKYGLTPTMTETEMIKKLGLSRIWDCGLIRYIWTSQNENRAD